MLFHICCPLPLVCFSFSETEQAVRENACTKRYIYMPWEMRETPDEWEKETPKSLVSEHAMNACLEIEKRERDILFSFFLYLQPTPTASLLPQVFAFFSSRLSSAQPPPPHTSPLPPLFIFRLPRQGALQGHYHYYAILPLLFFFD